MSKQNYSSDWLVQADQGMAIKAGLKNIEAEITGIHVSLDNVGFVRFCRDNDIDGVRVSQGEYTGNTILSTSTKGIPCFYASSRVK